MARHSEGLLHCKISSQPMSLALGRVKTARKNLRL